MNKVVRAWIWQRMNNNFILQIRNYFSLSSAGMLALLFLSALFSSLPGIDISWTFISMRYEIWEIVMSLISAVWQCWLAKFPPGGSHRVPGYSSPLGGGDSSPLLAERNLRQVRLGLFQIVIKWVAHSVATPALLCNKEPAQGTQSPLLGAFLAYH